MHYPGVDLAELWRAKRWRLLLNLIDHLPQASHYVDALANDDEVARVVADRPQEPHPGPRIAEWTPEYEALVNIQDLLGSVIQAVIASVGSKPPTIARTPRPHTAVDRWRARGRLDRHKALVAQLIPPKPGA